MTPIAQMIREHKKKKFDRLLLFTGARKQESERRMGYVVPMRREGARVWLSPFLEWSKADILDYKALHHLPNNEVVDLTYKSLYGGRVTCCRLPVCRTLVLNTSKL
jgi:3'-phosphoadenosine 5'-phosphosulfate sulfotransferase (PAPS reductase)/FAD synthetase